MSSTVVDWSRKIVPREHAKAACDALAGPRVFTNGVFDVLHQGHVSYLNEARALGASLVVALNSDASVRLLGKGDDRPLNPQGARAMVIAALASVDRVVLFDEKTPVELLKLVRPEIYVKGGDYDMRQLEETRWVESWGGEARALAFVPGFSTTALLRKVRGAGPDES